MSSCPVENGARLQRRIQRYGWDLAAGHYEALWQAQLAPAQSRLLACASLAPGERVLDVACGTGLVTFAAAQAVGAAGIVVGVDISGEMIDAAARRAVERNVSNASFARMDAEHLELPAAGFDVALCALGLMYVPDPGSAVREMRRMLRPGGRMVIAVWGARSHCGWSPVFEIVDAEVASEVCPLFFQLGQSDTLAYVCAEAGLVGIVQHRITTMLHYADGDEACAAAFVGGPVALAWSHFGDAVRARVCKRYLDAIEPWRHGQAYRVPGEFVVVSAIKPHGINDGATAPPFQGLKA
jgi:ubiquinone/menaquinone biosynthesis C-methylase UbiE